jgi:hypothetical protein
MNPTFVAWLYDDHSPSVDLEPIYRHLFEVFRNEDPTQQATVTAQFIDTIAWPMKDFMQGIVDKKDLFYIKRDTKNRHDVLYVRILFGTTIHKQFIIISVFFIQRY